MAGNKNSGRKPKLNPDERTLQTVTGLGNIQATSKECAAVLGVAEATWIKFKKDNPEIAEVLDKGKGEGRASLRRTQFKMAEHNAAMAIFLGKNYLGQTDRVDNRHEGSLEVTQITRKIVDPKDE